MYKYFLLQSIDMKVFNIDLLEFFTVLYWQSYNESHFTIGDEENTVLQGNIN